MNRCHRLSAMLLVSLLTAMPALGQTFTPPASPRAAYNFNPGWKFIRQDVPGADHPAFDASNLTVA